MALMAKDVIYAAAVDLKDLKGTRWSAAELVTHLNEAQRALILRRPDAAAQTMVWDLEPGARQDVPGDVMVFLGVLRNASARGRVVTPVQQGVLNATAPTWQSGPQSLEVRHFMYDAGEPRVFLVYPPARQGASVEVRAAPYPVNLARPSGPTFESVAGACAVGVEWTPALTHSVLFRAYSKDAEFGGSPALAQAHRALYLSELGVTPEQA